MWAPGCISSLLFQRTFTLLIPCILLMAFIGCGGRSPDAADSHQFPKVTITTASLPDATVGTPYRMSMTASGGSGSGNLWAIKAGTLPAGLSFTIDGVLSGTPTTAGTATLSINVEVPCFCVPQIQPQSDQKDFTLVVH